jgi:hypothetical protein
MGRRGARSSTPAPIVSTAHLPTWEIATALSAGPDAILQHERLDYLRQVESGLYLAYLDTARKGGGFHSPLVPGVARS